MSLPFTLPDWVPWWVPMVLLVPALLYALAFLFMPFSVLGVKSRLESMEARLDDLQNEMRLMTRGIPSGQEMDFEDVYTPAGRHIQPRQEPVIRDRPPVPPVVTPPDYFEEDEPVERPAPPPNTRPTARRSDSSQSPGQSPSGFSGGFSGGSSGSRPAPRSEPRLDKRW
jgi:hypothetical protein